MEQNRAVDVKKHVADADNQAIMAVGDKMKADHTRNRVTVYYLLAEHIDKLSAFN